MFRRNMGYNHAWLCKEEGLPHHRTQRPGLGMSVQMSSLLLLLP